MNNIKISIAIKLKWMWVDRKGISKSPTTNFLFLKYFFRMNQPLIITHSLPLITFPFLPSHIQFNGIVPRKGPNNPINLNNDTQCV